MKEFSFDSIKKMARLTEEMVAARTRASDLSTIKKLNCWQVIFVSLLKPDLSLHLVHVTTFSCQ